MGQVAAPAGFPGSSSPPGSSGTCSQTLSRGMLCSVGTEPVWEAPLKHSLSHFRWKIFQVAVTVKSSVCFAGLKCECFEGRAWLLCMYMWVWLFYTVLNVPHRGATVCKAMAFRLVET